MIERICHLRGECAATGFTFTFVKKETELLITLLFFPSSKLYDGPELIKTHDYNLIFCLLLPSDLSTHGSGIL